MATIVVVFKILFLVLIAHSFVALCGSQASTAASGRWTPPSLPGPFDDLSETAVLVSGAEQWSEQQPTSSLEVGPNGSTKPARQPPPRAPGSVERRIGDRFPPPNYQRDDSERPYEATPTSTPPTTTTMVNYAELCYLSNGGSSITLTVNEATQVGSTIGTVEVNGDPSLEGGNVDLFDAIEAPQWPRSSETGGGGGGGGESSAASESSGSQQPVAAKQRRILGRRSADLGQDRPHHQDSVEQAEWPLAGAGRRRDNSRQLATGSGAAHQSGPPPPLLGLINDHHQISQANHAASFYSLVASTVAPQPGAGGQAPPSQQAPAVRLDPGTKNLILVRSLDKESVEGEQSLVFNVRCSPRARADAKQNGQPGKATQQQQQDSTTIPVRILVTDANDHAPEFVGPQPYVVNISETTPIGTVVSRDIVALDRDSAGPHSTVHYRVLDDGSPHCALLQFSNPLEPTLVVAGQLDYETLASFTVTIVAQDQGEPEPLSATAQVHVNILDFDDQNPRFLDDKYSLIMDEAQQSLVGQNLQVLPRNLYAEDGDRGISSPILYSFDQLGAFRADESPASTSSSSPNHGAPSSGATDDNNIERYLHLNPASGEIRLIRQWPSGWLAGAPMTLVVRATQADNRDRYTLTTLTISARPASPRGRLATTAAPSAGGPAEEGDDLLRASNLQPGIEFAPDRLVVDVAENVPVNEKIARARAKLYLDGQAVGAATVESQVVDLVADVGGGSGGLFRAPHNKTAPQQVSSSNKRARVAELQQAHKRPINYQILDDQTDQFGINGLGDIFIKRPLDYEQRQEYKFRVLATYTKFSDICQVLVRVINVNDNKPNFKQPQYTFYLTESRLRSNLIGTVQAHDADLNDTIHYSLLGEHAHLFDISPSGQISLRSSIKLLNVTNCQLIAQATDSLGAPQNSHQARINLQVAPQLVGRSLNLADLQPPSESKLFNSRSLVDHRQAGSGDWSNHYTNNRLTPATNQKEPTSSSQRSSVATVMASFQHMLRSVNLFDMPMSSALLLSALLAFLVCLLFIVIISMSVHFYRRRSKSRHRHQLATATRLRHAHAAALHAGQAGGERARYLHGTGSAGGSSPGATDNTSSSPTNSAGLGGSPPLNYQLSPTAAAEQSAAKLRQLTSPEPLTGPRSCVGNQAATIKTIPKVAIGQRPHSVISLASSGRHRKSMRSPLEELSAQLEAVAATDSDNRQQQQQQPSPRTAAESPLISSLSSQSKRSYRSNTTDNSSVMHCGHYSITASQLSPPLKATPGQGASNYSHVQDSAGLEANGSDGLVKSAVSPRCGSHFSSPDCSPRQKMAATNMATSSNNLKLQPNELTVLTSSNPGMKSYRKLPHLGSLIRPTRSNRVGAAEQVARAMRRAPPVAANQINHLHHQNAASQRDLQDSAIASDASSSAGSGIAQQKQQKSAEQANNLRQPERRATPISGHNNYATDEEEERAATSPAADGRSSDSPRSLSPPPPPMNNIRWPRGAIPQRVKKLTWDDELSAANDDDCYVSPDVHLGGSGCPISPLGGSMHHQYPILGTTGSEDHYAEQHFLFSNPCSPGGVLVSTDFTSHSAAAANAQSANYSIGGSNGQENCFDYTIVESSQLRLDSIGSRERFENQQQQQSLSAQHHHLLQLQQQQQLQPINHNEGGHNLGQRRVTEPLASPHRLKKGPTPTTSYLYNNNSSSSINNNPISRLTPTTNHQDLKLMTTAVL